MSNPYQKYKTNAILSASREQILLMLYEGAIRFTKQALEAAESNRIADRGRLILRAYDIVLELQVSLDHKIGGDLSRQLDQLYTYTLDQFTKANMTGDTAALKSAIKVLENLYDGWQLAVNKIIKDNEAKGPNEGGT